MNTFLKILTEIFSSLYWLFLSSIFFTFISFHFVRKFLDNVKSGILLPLLFGILNGAIAAVVETMVSSNLPHVVMLFVPLTIVLELFCISKNPFRVYIFILGAFLINYCGIYSIILASTGLLWPELPNYLSAIDYRVFIFSFVTLIASCAVILLIRFIPLRELRSITYKTEQNLMLVSYMYAAAITFLVAIRLSTTTIFQFQGNSDYLNIIYFEMLIKDFTLLLGGYIILLFRCREKRQEQHAVNLKKDLQLEKDFRSSIQEKALCSYSYNATKDCMEQLHPAFNSYITNPSLAKYSQMINHYIDFCVHPDDQQALRKKVVHLDVEKKAQLKVNSLQVKMRREAIISFCSDAREIDTVRHCEGEWIWIEVRDTYITNAATGDLIVYVDLFNVEDVVQEKKLLEVAATTDKLTGLNNRSAAESRIQDFLSIKSHDGAFFIVDLDNFKLVNDRFGHPEGDKVLRDIANIIKSIFRDADVVARLGGDEFCVYAPGMTSLDAVNRCVAPLLSRCHFEYTYKGSNFVVTPSIGVVFASQANHDYDTLYHCADKALYNSKTKGKNTWSLYTGEEL